MRIFLLTIALLLGVGGTAASERVPDSVEQIQLSFAPVVRESAPAVVNIFAKVIVEDAVTPFATDPFFGQFFRNFGTLRPRIRNSLGSGVIVTGDGLVVSNFHVVEEATEIRAVLNDRREFDARVILADRESDIAILRLESADDLPALSLRDSDELEVGDLVLAIGNPFGIGQTVSSGIISGMERQGAAFGNGRGYFIQTDAAINPGNSGGALVDTAGRLVGVNTSILTRSGGSNGVGFAIPSNLVASFIEQAEHGNTTFRRPWSGILATAPDYELALALGMERPRGVIINDINRHSPFAVAGLAAGDVITKFDGNEIDAMQELDYRMAVVGDRQGIEIEYLRDEDIRKTQISIGPPPEKPSRDSGRIGGTGPLANIVIANINPALAAEANLSPVAEGAIILRVDRAGSRTRLRSGDIIRALNGKKTESAAEVRERARIAAPEWRVEFERNGRRYEVRFF